MPDAGVAKPVRAAMAEPAAEPATPPAAAASFDPSILKRLVGGSEDTAIEILGDFGDSAREILAEITEAHRAHSAANIAMAAHKLKSSSRAVGADAAAEVAERLERAGKTEAWGEIDTAAPELDGALRVALELIEAHIDEFLKRPK
jgi:HPt (histidine-containing phosphotransfer) domain-containing protein